MSAATANPAAAPSNTGSNTASNTGSASEEIIVSMDVDEVCCDGGNGALGHPQVWYSFNRNNRIVCGYCDRVFVKR